MGAPTGMHQGLSMELSAIFHDFLDDKPCRVYAAPYDVRLFAPLEADKDKENDKTVVEPDLVVVCDEKKRHPEACHGAPDLVIEILSPGTRALDLKYKFDKYLEAGVREYWVIDPDKRTILVYTLSGEKKKRFFDPYMYKEEDTVPVGIFNGALKISMKELFAKAERY
jgi:Uma2 family endonuclease